MSRISVISLLLLLLSFSSVLALDKGQGTQITILKDKDATDYRAHPRLSTAELCTVRHAGDAYWLIDYWVTGDEQYLAYQNPAMTCDKPYPFEVNEVYMLLYFRKEAILSFSAEVKTADMTNPDCPVPGTSVATSSKYTYQFKPAGLWRVIVPFDNPVEVNGPYFAGLTIIDTLVPDDAIDPVQDSISLLIDTYPEACMYYNYWDAGEGYVDLDDLAKYNIPNFPRFPGQLILYSAGMTGGTGGYEDPMPRITLLEPEADQYVGAPLRCWAWDKAASEIVDSVKFEQVSTGSWVRFGVDIGDSHALRNGVDPSGSGPGYAVDLSPVDLPEDTTLIRATAYDTLGRTASTLIQLMIDPTPPILDFIKPSAMDTIRCLPYTFKAYSDDENITSVKYYYKKLETDYSVSVETLHQTDYGNVDADPGDGNPIADGEFGEYYCGPVAGALAIKYWYDMGYTKLMRESTNNIPLDTVVERMATEMSTRANSGTYDDFFVGGLENYITYHGDELFVESYFTPDYLEVRTIFEEKEMLPVLGLSGNPGLYVVLSGMSGLDNGGGQYAITISDPLTGTSINTYMRNIGDVAQVLYDGSWLGLDIVIALRANNHVVSREEFGVASKVVSNWEYRWLSTTSLSDDSLYFITAIGIDYDNRKEVSSTLIRYHCNIDRVKGDFNNDGNSDNMDALYLINFIYLGGTDPIGGAHRADTNCDNQIDIGDVIYLVKYLFEAGEEPCY